MSTLVKYDIGHDKPSGRCTGCCGSILSVQKIGHKYDDYAGRCEDAYSEDD